MNIINYTVRAKCPILPRMRQDCPPVTEPTEVRLNYPDGMRIVATIIPDPDYQAIRKNGGVIVNEDGESMVFDVEYAEPRGSRTETRRGEWRYLDGGLTNRTETEWLEEFNATCADLLAAIYGYEPERHYPLFRPRSTVRDTDPRKAANRKAQRRARRAGRR